VRGLGLGSERGSERIRSGLGVVVVVEFEAVVGGVVGLVV
jgi:hypothetical protein